MLFSRCKRLLLPVLVLVLLISTLAPCAAAAPNNNYSLSVNKTTFAYGEDILVTATGTQNHWVGIYNAGVTPGSQTPSLYWYYVNRPTQANGGYDSGASVVIQKTTKNGNAPTVLPGGSYTIFLLEEKGGNSYIVKTSVNITIADTEGNYLQPLTGITYTLDNDTDGFANGTVTVTKSADNSATDCLMYWADSSGTPLTGYTALAKFKLTGTTTRHEMYDRTIIPSGAKKLIAYAVKDNRASEDAVSCDLPSGAAYENNAALLAEFQVVSDVHINASTQKHLTHFTQLLQDVKQYSPNSLGIFINGDIADTGDESQFALTKQLYDAQGGANSLPYLHMAIGNHDWSKNNPNNQFQKYVKILNPALPSQPSTVYYDETVGGYYFIYLGSDNNGGVNANLSATQLTWFDSKLASYTAANPDKPVFVFLHQAVYNTVAGTLPGQGWHGVNNEDSLKAIVKKYPQVILFGGHSHWELNSLQCLYPGDPDMSAALSTASVGYLWGSYDIVTGDHVDGSHGYYVRVYEDKVLYLGRDIENNLFIPSALFVVQRNRISTSADTYTLGIGETADLGISVQENAGVTYANSNSSAVSLSDATVKGLAHGSSSITVTAAPGGTTVVDRKTVTVNVHSWNAATCQTPKTCSVCGATSGSAGGHRFDRQVVADRYLATPATCQTTATYYFSCSCGATGTDTFASGSTASHNHDQQNTDSKYLATEATCQKAATYYYSCVCGDKGDNIFSSGPLASHSHTQRRTEETYLASQATCLNPAAYYFSCICGNIGEETFCPDNTLAPCKDLSPKDHSCDVCGKPAGEPHQPAAGSHICGYCGQSAESCADQFPRDHVCDVCGQAVGEPHRAGEGSHICDYCQLPVTTCKDDNPKNHLCDICGEPIGPAHEAAQGKHTCDYCGQNVSGCTDTDPADGYCDICGTKNHVCEDRDPKDHKCDFCLSAMGDPHLAGNGGHTCNYCNQKVTDCDDINPKDHVCDVCGEPFGPAHEAAAGSHNCGYCGLPASQCGDAAPKDHVCDVCGEPFGPAHEAAAGSHNCGYCGLPASQCVDTAPRDHVCDVCGEPFGPAHEAAAGSHNCGYCGLPASQCGDAPPKDHACDVCGESIGLKHEAAIGSHICSYCGQVASIHIYNQKLIDSRYLVHPASCTQAETYYYSCLCGEADSTTFSLGSPLGHSFSQGKCSVCGTPDPDWQEPEAPVTLDRLAGENRFETAFAAADEMKELLGTEKFGTVIVASGADFADALSGSYLAAKRKAPILLSYKAAQNARVQNYIRENLAENGTVYILGGTSAVPGDMEEGLSGIHVKRLAGSNRFETNLLILEEAGVVPGEEILVATGTNFADCLSASALGKPILLVHRKLLDSQKNYLPTLTDNHFTVIGGESAVSKEVANELAKFGSVQRLAGKNRYETSVLVAQRYFSRPTGVVLAYARNFPDGLCGGALAAAAGYPLLLTDSKYYSIAAEYAANNPIREGHVLGGETLISEKAIRSILGQ